MVIHFIAELVPDFAKIADGDDTVLVDERGKRWKSGGVRYTRSEGNRFSYEGELALFLGESKLDFGQVEITSAVGHDAAIKDHPAWTARSRFIFNATEVRVKINDRLDRLVDLIESGDRKGSEFDALLDLMHLLTHHEPGRDQVKAGQLFRLYHQLNAGRLYRERLELPEGITGQQILYALVAEIWVHGDGETMDCSMVLQAREQLRGMPDLHTHTDDLMGVAMLAFDQQAADFEPRNW